MDDNSVALPKGRILSAVCLVAGTTIGGGMLALPVATGVSGFLPSLVVMFVCWLVMTLSALLLIEVSLWMEEGVHFISMTSRILGAPGRWLCWVLYLFICYASIVGYTAGGGMQMVSAIKYYFGYNIPLEVAAFIFLVVFGVIVDLGAAIVGRVNAVLFIAMIAAYFALVGMGIDEVNPTNLMHQYWPLSLMAIPLTLTTFSFHTMVPSLTPYMKRNGRGLRIAVIAGTIITFLVYAIWQWLILGIVPVHGEKGLAEALQLGQPATQFVREHVEGWWIGEVAEYFAFFAIVTSFLGIGLGLVDFLADGLKIKKEGKGKILIGSLILIPSWIFATQFERVFLVAMELSGGIGDSILSGMIPVLMVWIGRYRMGYTGPFQVGGGKLLLAFVFICFFFAFLIQILAYVGVGSLLLPTYQPPF